jgi:hypothetical protein
MSIRRDRRRSFLTLESLENRLALSHVSPVAHLAAHIHKVHAAAHVATLNHSRVTETPRAAEKSSSTDPSTDAKPDSSADPNSGSTSIDTSSPDTSSQDLKGHH